MIYVPKISRRAFLSLAALSPAAAYAQQRDSFRSRFQGEFERTVRYEEGKIDGWETRANEDAKIERVADGLRLMATGGGQRSKAEISRYVRDYTAEKWELSFRARNIKPAGAERGRWGAGAACSATLSNDIRADYLEFFYCGSYSEDAARFNRSSNSKLLSAVPKETPTSMPIDEKFHLFEIKSDGGRSLYFIDGKPAGLSELQPHRDRYVHRVTAVAFPGGGFIIDDVNFRTF